jgi:putative transposase
MAACLHRSGAPSGLGKGQLVTDALVMAIWRRGKPDALLHHSDRGSQGGFNPSAQHPDGGCDDGSQTRIGSVHTKEIAFTWSPTSLAA